MSFSTGIFWSFALPTLVAGSLIIHPKDTEAKVNDSTYLNCSTSISTKPIHWHHGNEYVYAGDGIMEPYLGRFDIEINPVAGVYNLVIRSVRPEDAGEYTCIDGGIGESSSAQLIVLDEVPSCYFNFKHVVDPRSNTGHMESEELQLACTVRYHGNIPPVLEWISVGTKRFDIQGKSFNINGDRLLIYAQVVQPSVELEIKSLVCQTTRSRKNQQTCNLKVNGMLCKESSSTKASISISLLSLVVAGCVKR